MEFAGTTTVTRQGQVTLPKKARKKSAYEKGDIFEVYFSNELILMKKKKEPLAVFRELAEKTAKRFREKGMKEDDVQREIELYRKAKQ